MTSYEEKLTILRVTQKQAQILIDFFTYNILQLFLFFDSDVINNFVTFEKDVKLYAIEHSGMKRCRTLEVKLS